MDQAFTVSDQLFGRKLFRKCTRIAVGLISGQACIIIACQPASRVMSLGTFFSEGTQSCNCRAKRPGEAVAIRSVAHGPTPIARRPSRRTSACGGVVIVPRALEAEVVTGALKKARGEKIVREPIEGGMSATAAFQKFGIP